MKKIICLLVMVVSVCTCATGCESWKRVTKSASSNWGGGLERTVTVYDYNGGKIKSYTGKFDISDSENEIFFDLNGKRVIIHGGIIIDEED